VIAGFGRRDVPIDDQLPVLLGRYGSSRRLEPVEGVTVDKLNDQHAFLTVPEDLDIAPGELLSLGLSHPCGAFDRWPSIPLVDDDHTVLGTITTDL
jgi:D-serine dehydratase